MTGSDSDRPLGHVGAHGGTVIADYKSPDSAVVTHIRGTLLASSLAMVREFGFYERYLEHLPAEHREAILFALATEWIPIELALVHYRTCDALEVGDETLNRIGGAVSGRIMGTLLGTFVRTSGRTIGVTPWVPLSKYGLLWSRIHRGGSCRAEQVGPKDAICYAYGNPLFDSRYFRGTYVGVMRGAGAMFARNVVARARPTRDPHSMVITLSWV